MDRKTFNLNLPFREIKQEDVGILFDNELLESNGVDLAFLFEKNMGNLYVFVYELDGKVLAFIEFIDTGTHFHLDLVETNRLFPTPSLKPGGKLILLLELISKQNNYSKITLNSVQNKVEYYKKLGYTKTGETIPNVAYGPLTKMEKTLN